MVSVKLPELAVDDVKVLVAEVFEDLMTVTITSMNQMILDLCSVERFKEGTKKESQLHLV
jgi:hypothetical protein